MALVDQWADKPDDKPKKKKSKKRKDTHHWWEYWEDDKPDKPLPKRKDGGGGASPWGFSKNFAKDAATSAVGLGPALYNMGKMGLHDVGEGARSFGSGLQAGMPGPSAGRYKAKYQTPKLANAIKADYKYTYGPLLEGDMGTFRHRVYEHPLGPVLDVAAVLSLGAGSVARGGKLAATVGKDGGAVQRAGAKVAGLERRPVLEGETPETMRIKEIPGQKRQGLAFTKPGAKIRGNTDEVLLPKRRNLVARGKGEELQTPLRTKNDQARADLVEDGKGVEIGSHSENPLTRFNERTFDALSEALPEWFGIGASRRVGRLQAQELRRSTRRKVGAAGTYAAEKGLRSGELKPLRKGGDDYERRMAQVELSNRAEGVTASEMAPMLERNATDLGGGLNPEGRLKSREKQLKDLADPKSALSKSLARRGVDPVKAAEDLEARIWAMGRREELLPQVTGRAKLQRDLADNGLPAKYEKPVNAALEMFGRIADDTTKTIDQATVKSVDGSEALANTARAVGRGEVREGAFPFPRTQQPVKGSRAKERLSIYNKPASPRRPDSARKRTGKAMRFGVDGVRPEVVPWANRVANDWLRARKTLDKVVAARRALPSADAPTPKGWIRMDKDAKLRERVERLRQFIDDEAPVLFGDSPQLEQMRAFVEKSIEDMATPSMVPRGVYKKLMEELEPTTRVPVIDGLTGAWRTATLSAVRPAFLTGNIGGQTALLLLAHSTLDMLRPMIRMGMDDDTRAAWRQARESGEGGLLGTGPSSYAREQSAMLKGDKFWDRLTHGASVKAGGLTDWMARVSQAVTDDPYRRIAFMAELNGPARKLLKERRKTDPNFTFGDALRQLVGDERIMDRVERKVLDDLVDFENLSKAERQVVRRYLNPVYSWVKGSSRLTALMVKRRPAFSAGLYQLGEQGYEDQVKAFGGKVPDYTMGLIRHGKDKVISTAQYNPFLTPTDTAQQVLKLFGGNYSGEDFGPDNWLASTTPPVKMLTALGTGIDPFTGEDLKGTDIQKMLQSFTGSFPQVRGVQNALSADDKDDEGNPVNNRRLFPRSPVGELLKYLGSPVRDFNVDQALKYGDQQRLFGRVEFPTGDGAQYVTGPDGKAYWLMPQDRKTSRSGRSSARRSTRE